MKSRWQVRTPPAGQVESLSRELGLAPLLVRCLLNRGIDSTSTITSFLEPRLKSLGDPFLLPNMSRAVDRLHQAREKAETVVIFGDYDVDGVTSATLLLEAFERLGWRAECYLPHRLDEGYGLSQEGVENCFRRFSPTLLLAVDCGSTAVQSIEWLNAHRVDVLVLDHHQVSSPQPAALALVNPQLLGDDPAGVKGLCSAGLAFKLVHALVKRGRETGLAQEGSFDVRELLDLVALGTVADMVPLTGENRILVQAGLERLESTQRAGLVALKRVAGVTGPVKVFHVGYQLGPRLNAAGRLEQADKSLRLLRSSSIDQALPIAEELNLQNRERQEIERSITAEAAERVRQEHDPEKHLVIVVGNARWHVGVVGIVASKLQKEHYRPVIVFGGDGAEWRGSGRSIVGFDLAAALQSCASILLRQGGHAMAAGVSILPERVEEFRARLNEIASSQISREQLMPPLDIDAELKLSELSLDLLEMLGRLEPTGQGNHAPVFAVRGVQLASAPFRMGAEKKHVRMTLGDGHAVANAVMWNCVETPPSKRLFDVAFSPEINDFKGRRTVQLKVLDWRLSE